MPHRSTVAPLLRKPLSILSLLAVSASFLFTAEVASAEESGSSATGKGITGGALLGGELVMAIEAAFGVQNTWAYVGGGVGGAVIGGVGGYFVEQGSSTTPAHVLLAGGLVLLIPTTVAVLQAASYKAPDHYITDDPGVDTAPEEEAPKPTKPGTTVKVTAPEAKNSTEPKPVAMRPRIPLSLVDMHEGDFRLGVPGVQVFNMYSQAEVRTYGVGQHLELRFPVFHARF